MFLRTDTHNIMCHFTVITSVGNVYPNISIINLCLFIFMIISSVTPPYIHLCKAFCKILNATSRLYFVAILVAVAVY